MVTRGLLPVLVLSVLDRHGAMNAYQLAATIAERTQRKIVPNYGTIHPIVRKLEAGGYIRTAWHRSANNRVAKLCEITDAGRALVVREAAEWEQTITVVKALMQR